MALLLDCITVTKLISNHLNDYGENANKTTVCIKGKNNSIAHFLYTVAKPSFAYTNILPIYLQISFHYRAV